MNICLHISLGIRTLDYVRVRTELSSMLLNALQCLVFGSWETLVVNDHDIRFGQGSCVELILFGIRWVALGGGAHIGREVDQPNDLYNLCLQVNRFAV